MYELFDRYAPWLVQTLLYKKLTLERNSAQKATIFKLEFDQQVNLQTVYDEMVYCTLHR